MRRMLDQSRRECPEMQRNDNPVQPEVWIREGIRPHTSSRDGKMNIALVIVIALFGLGGACAEWASTTSGPEFTSDGQMKLPENYREWVYLTTGFDMSYNPAMNMGHHMFDNVFVNPEAYKAFLNTGTWPDKTVMVLEGRGAQSRGSINKAGNFQGEVMGMEVHVKDEARFPASGLSSASMKGRPRR